MLHRTRDLLMRQRTLVIARTFEHQSVANTMPPRRGAAVISSEL
jgi:hypothetical protein